MVQTRNILNACFFHGRLPSSKVEYLSFLYKVQSIFSKDFKKIHPIFYSFSLSMLFPGLCGVKGIARSESAEIPPPHETKESCRENCYLLEAPYFVTHFQKNQKKSIVYRIFSQIFKDFRFQAVFRKGLTYGLLDFFKTMLK